MQHGRAATFRFAFRFVDEYGIRRRTSSPRPPARPRSTGRPPPFPRRLDLDVGRALRISPLQSSVGAFRGRCSIRRRSCCVRCSNCWCACCPRRQRSDATCRKAGPRRPAAAACSRARARVVRWLARSTGSAGNPWLAALLFLPVLVLTPLRVTSPFSTSSEQQLGPVQQGCEGTSASQMGCRLTCRRARRMASRLRRCTPASVISD